MVKHKTHMLVLGLLIPATSFSAGYDEAASTSNNRTVDYYNKQLLDAAQTDDKQGVVNALEHGAYINYQTPVDSRTSNFFSSSAPPSYQGTALHFCAKRGNLDIARILLDRSAQTTIMNFKGCIPLHIAADYLQVDMFTLLLDKTPDCCLKTLQCKRLISMFKARGYNKDVVQQHCAIINTAEAYLAKRWGSFIDRTLKSSELFAQLPPDIKRIIIDLAVTQKLEAELYSCVWYNIGVDAVQALKRGANINISIKAHLPFYHPLNKLAKPTLFHLAVYSRNSRIAKLLLKYCIEITQDDLRRDFADIQHVATEPFIQLIKKYEAKRAQSAVKIEELE